jgi:malate dehydrogenase (oxaloacetate-decarboxylating)
MEHQLRRTYTQFGRQVDDLGNNVYLANLRDRKELLFYRLLTEHLEEMLPIVYTPTTGRAIERFSHEFRRPRRVYLSVDYPDDVEVAFRNYMSAEDVDLIVATDSEGIWASATGVSAALRSPSASWRSTSRRPGFTRAG